MLKKITACCLVTALSLFVGVSALAHGGHGGRGSHGGHSYNYNGYYCQGHGGYHNGYCQYYYGQ